MDASIMEGRTLRAGAVGSIERIVHPITAARLVMDETSHVLLVGRPATRFAQHFKLERQSAARPAARRAKRRGLAAAFAVKTLRLYRAMANAGLATRERLGRETVGAVALDRERTVAAGASTGGIDCMLPGRVGDTPLIGCGIYADNRAGAVSMTGLGESIIRVAVAKEITDRLADGFVPSASARVVLKKLVSRIRGAAGALVLSPDGRFAIMHTTPRMAAGWWDGTRKPVVKDRFK
jgi:beta-aspartyl-peptidase (threonine type)